MLRHQSGVNFARTVTISAPAGDRRSSCQPAPRLRRAGERQPRRQHLGVRRPRRKERCASAAAFAARLFFDLFNITNSHASETISRATGLELPEAVGDPRAAHGAGRVPVHLLMALLGTGDTSRRETLPAGTHLPSGSSRLLWGSLFAGEVPNGLMPLPRFFLLSFNRIPMRITIPGMKRAQIERLSVRTALAIGFCVTLGLWLYTGYAFTQRIETVRRDAAEVASRYTRAQELLSTVRAQVLLSSVRVRDALLNPEPAAVSEYRDQMDASYRIITMALADYEPVMGSGVESDQIRKLRDEVEQFHDTSKGVLSDAAGRSPAAVREILNRSIVPRREAALAISEEIQALNRRAFIQQQSDIAEIHRVAELQSRRNLGVALVIGLGVLLMTSWYAGRLESRLRLQMERDARISRELRNTAAKLMTAQEEERRTIARELHDEVGQVLTAIKVELALAQRSIEAGGGSAAPLVEAQTITDGALADRAQPHPAAASSGARRPGVAGGHRRLAARAGAAAQHPRRIAPDRAWPIGCRATSRWRPTESCRRRITNVAKHAHATQCQVRLTHLADRLVVEVEDNGVGFNPQDTSGRSWRAGWDWSAFASAPRASAARSTCSAVPATGTRLVVELPERGVLA